MFANLAIAWGLGAVSIPILIHLLNRQRYRTIEWAAMEFLLKAIKQNARKLQLRDIILMIIRTLAVLFFVLALMRPVVCSLSAGGYFGAESVRVFVVDISGSMDSNDGGKTVMQATIESIRETVKRSAERSSGGSRTVLITTPADSSIELPDGASDPTVFDGHLAAIKQTGGSADFPATMERVRGLVEERFAKFNVEVFVFSDLQKVSWPVDNRELIDSMGALSKDNRHIYMIDVGKQPRRNITIESFRSIDDTVLVGHEIPFLAMLKNHGETEQDTTAELLVNGVVKYQQVVTVKPGGSEQLSFSVRPDTRGEHRVQLKLSTDNLLIDNEASRILMAEDKLRVLIIDGNPRDQISDSPGLFLKKVYTTTDLDLAALENGETVNGGTRAARNSGIARIPVDEWSEQNLADAHLICLAGVSHIPPGMGAKLKRFVARGGGLMIFPPNAVDAGSYHRELGVAAPPTLGSQPTTAVVPAAGAPAGGSATGAPASDDELSLLPCTYGEWWGEIPDPKNQTPTQFHSISSKDISHPILLPFSDAADYQQLLANLKVYRGLQMQLVATDSPDIGIVARLDDGQLLAATRSAGSGRVLMWSSACDTQMSNLPWFAAYYILMQRSAEYLTIGSHPPLNLVAGDELLHPVGELDAGAYYQLTDPFTRKETMPAPHRRGARWVVSPADPLLFPGFVTVEKGAGAQAETMATDGAAAAVGRTEYAVSARPEEFSLSAWSENALPSVLPGVKYTYLKDSKNLTDALLTGSQGIELWWFFILLVFALLVLESYLVILWKPGSVSDDPADPSAAGANRFGVGLLGQLGRPKPQTAAAKQD